MKWLSWRRRYGGVPLTLRNGKMPFQNIGMNIFVLPARPLKPPSPWKLEREAMSHSADEPEFSEAELAVIQDRAEALVEWQDALEPLIKAKPQGAFKCPACAGNARWDRTGRNFTLECDCGWGGVGCFDSCCDN